MVNYQKYRGISDLGIFSDVEYTLHQVSYVHVGIPQPFSTHSDVFDIKLTSHYLWKQ